MTPEAIQKIRDRLKLTIEEMQRLEGEGGNPATKAQADDLERLIKIYRRLEGIGGMKTAAPEEERTKTSKRDEAA
ncbi:MAG: hypothetical protein WDO70_12145 [Alphaproteobacteria bacterium]